MKRRSAILSAVFLLSASSGNAQERSKSDLENEVRQLRKKVSQLEATLAEKQASGAMGGMGHGMMGMKGNCKNPPCGGSKMGGMGHGMNGMKGMKQGMGKGMDHGMKGMKQGMGKGMGHGMMGMKQGGMGHGMNGNMQMPGNSAANQKNIENHSTQTMPMKQHLLHIGASDFFLDHSGHLNLNASQTDKIQKIKSDYFAKAAKLQEKVQNEEAKLYELTSAITPSMKKIRRQVREIESHKAEERAEFIGSVNKALSILNSSQREMLISHHSNN